MSASANVPRTVDQVVPDAAATIEVKGEDVGTVARRPSGRPRKQPRRPSDETPRRPPGRPRKEPPNPSTKPPGRPRGRPQKNADLQGCNIEEIEAAESMVSLGGPKALSTRKRFEALEKRVAKLESKLDTILREQKEEIVEDEDEDKEEDDDVDAEDD